MGDFDVTSKITNRQQGYQALENKKEDLSADRQGAKEEKAVQNKKSVPMYLLEKAVIVLDLVTGVQTAEAAPSKETTVKKTKKKILVKEIIDGGKLSSTEIDKLLLKLEAFSISKKYGGYYLLNGENTRSGGISPYTIDFTKPKTRPVSPGKFIPKYPLLQITGELLDKVSTGPNYKAKLERFQQKCADNKVFAKHFELSEQYANKSKSKADVVKRIKKACKDAGVAPESCIIGTDVIPPVVQDGWYGRQTARAMIFVYELGMLSVEFGLVKDFDDYMSMFDDAGEEYKNLVLEFKKFIAANDTVRKKFLGTDQINEPNIPSIKGNTGEAIIGLYRNRKNIKPSNLVNISATKTPIMLRDKIKSSDTQTLRNLPAVFEAKKILYSCRKDGKRIYPEHKTGDDGRWSVDDAFNRAMNKAGLGSEINKTTAKKLLDMVDVRTKEIKKVLQEGIDKKNDLKELPSSTLKSWKKTVEKIEKDIKSGKISKADGIYEIDKTAKKIEEILMGKNQEKAEKMINVAEKAYKYAQGHYNKRITKAKTPVLKNKEKGEYSTFNTDHGRPKIIDAKSVYKTADNESLSEDEKKKIFMKTISKARPIIDANFKKFTEKTGHTYKEGYDEFKGEIKKLVPGTANRREKLMALKKELRDDLKDRRDDHKFAYDEAKRYGVDAKEFYIGDKYKIGDLEDEIDKIIAGIEMTGGIEKDLAALRSLIEKAVSRQGIYNPNCKDIKELEAVLKKLETGDFNELSRKPDEFLLVRDAGKKAFEVRRKVENKKDTGYYDGLKTTFDGHINYFIERVKNRIEELKKELAGRREMAFVIGEGDIPPEKDVAGFGAARKQLYYLDHMKANMNVSGGYKGMTDEEFRICDESSTYFIKCAMILENKEKFKVLLANAEKIYEAKLDKIYKRRNLYLSGQYFKVINGLSFEECLKYEIEGARLSYAGTALAQAYYVLNKTKDEYKKLITKDNRVKMIDRDGLLRGVPKQIMTDFKTLEAK